MAAQLHLVQGGPAEELLTIDEVAQLSKFSRKTIQREITAKRLKAKKMIGGRAIRITVTDYNSWAKGI